MYDLLRLPTWPSEAGHQGRHICCPAGRAPDLYHEVYKLWRLLGSPPGETELVAEVVSSLEDHLG